MIVFLSIFVIIVVITIILSKSRKTVDDAVSKSKYNLRSMELKTKNEKTLNDFNFLKKQAIEYNVIPLDTLETYTKWEADDDDFDKIQQLLNLLGRRTNETLEPQKDVRIRLHKNETCYYSETDLTLSLLKTTSYTIMSSGVRTNMNGLRTNLSNVQVFKDEEFSTISTKMEIFVTDKRVVLIDGTKNYSINLSDIVDIILEQNSFYLVVKNRNPYKITGNFNFKYFNITTANIKPFICDQIYNIVKTINLLLKQ